MADLNAWSNTVNGRYIDVDVWAGNQCWDLSQAWLTACNGGVLWTQPSNYPGLAAGSWEVATGNTANTADLLRHVTPIDGSQPGQAGDIPIWAYGSPNYPISHTAVLIQDRGPNLSCLSQNSSPARPDLPGYSADSSGPTIYQELPRAGLLGFLRPRATIAGQTSGVTPIPSTEEGFLMSLSDADQIEVRDNLRKVVGWLNEVKNNVAPINTSTGPKSLRQFVADGTRAAQASAAQTADINTAQGPKSVRQFVADGTRASQKLEPIVVDIAKAVSAPDVDVTK